MRLTKMAIERKYSDNSGVEFGVALNDGEVEIRHVHTIAFPVEELDWFISALTRIKNEIAEPKPQPVTS